VLPVERGLQVVGGRKVLAAERAELRLLHRAVTV
jgi:hypothetical protein